MQMLWLLLKKLPAPPWWILVFWLLICLNKNYLYISVRLSNSPCDYCLWKWERRSRKFPCHRGLMYTQIMAWLQLRWAPCRIVCLRLWQLPAWQGLLVFLVIDAFCINVIHWWCLLLCKYGDWLCVCVCGNGVFNAVRGREASRTESILNVSYPPRFTEADQKWIVFKGHLHVWRWYIYQALRATSVEKEKDSRIWRRGAKTTRGDGWWEDMTEVVEGGRGVKGSNMNFTHIHRHKAVLLYYSVRYK